MRAMGHSSVTVSQRYGHPTPETVERAFERLEERNRRAAEQLKGQGRQSDQTLPTTPIRQLPATVELEQVDAVPQVA